MGFLPEKCVSAQGSQMLYIMGEKDLIDISPIFRNVELEALRPVWIYALHFHMFSDSALHSLTQIKHTELLCIRTLRGRSLRHPSFVVVVHQSFTEINSYCSLRTTQYQKYPRTKLSKRCCQDVACDYRPFSVLKNNRKNHNKS